MSSQSRSKRATTIYALIDPITKRVRYVGKTVKEPSARLSAHMSSCDERCYHSARWLSSLKDRGLVPEISVLIKVPHGHDWSMWERFWISWFRGINPDLTNHTEGGDGAVTRGSRGRVVSCGQCGQEVFKYGFQIKKHDHLFCGMSCKSKFFAGNQLSKREREADSIVSLHSYGLSYDEIAGKVGLSRATIWKVLKSRGLTKRTKRWYGGSSA